MIAYVEGYCKYIGELCPSELSLSRLKVLPSIVLLRPIASLRNSLTVYKACELGFCPFPMLRLRTIVFSIWFSVSPVLNAQMRSARTFAAYALYLLPHTSSVFQASLLISFLFPVLALYSAPVRSYTFVTYHNITLHHMQIT